MAVSGGATSRRARVIAIVGSGARARLEPVDARTLAPLPGAWSLGVPKAEFATLSPSGKKIAVVTRSTLVVDAATGRVEHRFQFGGDISSGVYWFDQNDARPFLVGVGFDCGSTGVGSCGAELTTAGYGPTDDSTYGGTEGAGPAIQQGLVLQYNPTSIDVYHDGATDIPIDLPEMPQSAPYDVVADVARDRLFEISSAGLVAEIDHVGQALACSDCISYHTVNLNGKPFTATWAGNGKIALSGEDGLGMIDTRTWTTQAVTANPNIGVLATPLGLATWTGQRADGITVYRPDGSKRLQVLIGTPIRTVVSLGNFLYVDRRYSVDLRTGKVFGPTKQRTRVVTPTLVPIP
jgi:hypothetical protein